MDWSILGIAPTKDKKAITDAYRQKLRQTNPEDKPEEFKLLRTAYEEALAFADRDDTAHSRDESPVGIWMEAVERVYKDLPSRIDPACWTELLNSDVCIGLDTRPAAEEALMQFLMENYHLPRAVWQVLDQTFQFSARVEELYEAWPRDFIDLAVLSGIRFEPALDYGLFIPGTSGTACDAYLRLYLKAKQAPLDEMGALLEQMDALSERHPYGEALRCHFYIETGRAQEGRDGIRQLAADYPDDASLTLAWAELCLGDGNTEEAAGLACHILELRPEHTAAKLIYAKCLAEKQQYHEAKELAYDILHSSTDNPTLMEELTQLMTAWNEELIVRREAAYAQAPEDTDNAIELAWCYAQNRRDGDAMELAQSIDPNCADPFSYHNLMSKLYHNTGRFSEALPHLQAAEVVLQGMTEDGTAKTHKRIAKLPEILQLQGSCLSQLGRAAEAREKFEQALAVAPEDPEMLLTMGKLLFDSADYSYAAQILRRLVQLSPRAWVAHVLLALCLYYMRRDREAFDTINRAIDIQGNDLSLYITKMQILLRNEVFEDVHEILSFLEESNAPQDIATDFIRAELTELEKKDVRTALRQYQALQKRVEAGEDLFLSAELYHHLAVLTGNQLDLSFEPQRKTVLELIDKGLSFQEQDPDLLAYKAWVLKTGGLPEEAIAMYQKLAEKNPQSDVALRGAAELYYEDLNLYAAEALACYEKLLQRQQSAELYFYAATCKRHLGDLDGARLYYLKELEMDPDDVDGFRGLALICDTRGQYAESLELLDQALAVMEAYDRTYDWIVEHKAKVLRRLGRFEEALAFAREAARRYHYADALQLQFDICCQAGLWDRARQVLEHWKKEDRRDPALIAANGRLNLLQGNMFKAVLAMGTVKHKLPFKQVQDFRLQLADLECNHQRQIEIWSHRVNQDPTDDHALMHLAHAYWHIGNKTAAQGAAQRALNLLDNLLSQNLTDEALYRSRRSLVLAILGRAEEAKAELARTRALPLCDFCEYGRCKDADIYEAAIEEILGNPANAEKLYTAGKANWPDDLDFAAGEIRLKKKGRA